MKKIINLVVFLTVIYSVGIVLGLILFLLKITGRIKVLHPERFPRRKKSFLLVSNHPSLADPIVVLYLFFPDMLFHPLKFTPFHTPDKNNFYNPWYFFWIRPFSISINRNSENSESGGIVSFLRRMKRFLENGKRIILFPEGGRTYKGSEFCYSEKGKRIRKLTDGVGWLAVNTGVPVVPVWMEGTDKFLPNTPKIKFIFPRFWKKILIKIGNPLKLDREGIEEATGKIEQLVLNLADEEG